jgi:hypothetical protein
MRIIADPSGLPLLRATTRSESRDQRPWRIDRCSLSLSRSHWSQRPRGSRFDAAPGFYQRGLARGTREIPPRDISLESRLNERGFSIEALASQLRRMRNSFQPTPQPLGQFLPPPQVSKRGHLGVRATTAARHRSARQRTRLTVVCADTWEGLSQLQSARRERRCYAAATCPRSTWNTRSGRPKSSDPGCRDVRTS